MYRPISLTSAVVLFALAGSECARPLDYSRPVITPAGVRFTLKHPTAHRVTLAGSFNSWSTSSHPLVQEKPGGTWIAVVALPPGEHFFMYVVDDAEWVSPPVAEDYVDDGFGSKNGVVIVNRAP